VLRGRIASLSVFALVTLVTALYAVFAVGWDIPPFEDAAILMRYAEHLAHGEGIVWNIGEPPVDGATDFLFMVSVAVVHGIGLSLETATRFIAALAHFLTVGLIYIGMRRVQSSGVLPAIVTAGYFAVGPGLFLAAAYFGTALFSFAVAVAWLLAQRIMLVEAARTRDFLYFSLASLMVGLIRPEGVLISAFMLMSIGVVLSVKKFAKLFVVFVCIFFLLGGIYFIWHWSYFGYPLPNPFYVKGNGHLYIPSLMDSIEITVMLLLPFIPAFLLSVRSRNTFRLGLAFSIPIIFSTGMWVLLSSEMNFGGRFQYSALSLGCLSWYPLVKPLWRDWHLPKPADLLRKQQILVISAAGIGLASVFAIQIQHSTDVSYARDSRYEVGLMLSKFADRKYTMATTEAGLLSLYSKWRTIDTWGLNDEWIAHNGGITQQYLEQQRPAIIVFHAVAGTSSPRGARWNKQVSVLREYAEQHHFKLAAAFGVSPKDMIFYNVKPDLAESDEIVQAIGSTDYAWFKGGKAENFAKLHSPDVPR
jgi:arabinofuranosyltransferase